MSESAIAATSQRLVMYVNQFLPPRCSCIAGWSWKCLDNWLIFSRLAFAGGIMVCLEWWSFEVFLFVAGWYGNVVTAVIVANTCMVLGIQWGFAEFQWGFAGLQ